MKIKTFILTFILFLSVFFVSLILTSALFFDLQTQLAMERSINELYLISDTMGRELKNLIGRGADREEAVRYLFEYYSGHYSRQKGYLEIYKQDQLLYTSFKDSDGKVIDQSWDNNRTALMRNVNGNSYVVVAGMLPQPDNDEYKIQYIYDITYTITIWETMRNSLLLIGICCSVVIAVLLILLLNYIFKPMAQVITVSKEIADGHYDRRILGSKNQELIALSHNFNYMAEKIQGVIKELSDDAEQKQQFVDNFSHEIRTPLTSVYGFAEYMQKSVLREEEVIRISGYIMEDSRHILNIADRLLDLATLRNKSIIKAPCSVEALYQSGAVFLRKRLQDKEICLIRKTEVASIYGDEDLLQSLLINITNNAIDASEPGSRIEWKTYREGEAIVLSVMDEGKGIPSEDMGKIQEPFYRVDKSRSRESGNAGLGLAICRQIAQCHDARIRFESGVNTGTTVKIIFTIS